MSSKYWLLKAEPDSRIAKGKDVKFSVDDFESVKTTPWEGVRNYEARNLMKEMKVGDKALFYHSNCKNPGIAGFAQVSKEAYPDYTAWDTTHPYYDAKTKQDDPKWFMVDLTFVSRSKYFIPLALLRHIADLPSSTPPPEVEYIGESGVNAIKTMNLVARGRLSVQRVEQKAWDIVEMMAERGGWEEMDLRPKKAGGAAKKTLTKKGKTTVGKKKKGKKLDDGDDDDESEGKDSGDNEDFVDDPEHRKAGNKRKAKEVEADWSTPPRRSTRIKK